LLEHLAVNLEPVAEQDHDERDGGEVGDEWRARVELQPVGPTGPDRETDEHEHRGQGQEAASREARGERPGDEEPTEDEQRDVELVDHQGGRQQQLQFDGPHPFKVSEREERSGVRITVLGKSPSWQDAGGACSGYLIQAHDHNLLLDCGCGVFSKLRRFCDYVDVSAVVISHLHADHFLDLIPFSYALTYAPRQQPVAVGGWPGTDHPARPHLYAPLGATELFRQIVGAWGNEDLIEHAFHVHEFDAFDEFVIGPLAVRFCEVPHYTPTYAVELVCNGSRVTYSADCSPNEALIRFARNTDLFLVEATLPRPERTGVRGHLTPREAGEHGRRAAVRKLVLTHFSDELDPGWALAEAEAGYGCEVELAAEGAVYTIG
jgi:ribonuclease BN (tRNA processing enzyme)